MKKAFSFSTSPIQFSNLDNLEEFVKKLSSVRIDALNFEDLDDSCDADAIEPDLEIGERLIFDINHEENLVTIHGAGGFSYYNNSITHPSKHDFVLRPLIEDFFDFQFYLDHQEMVIYQKEITLSNETNTTEISLAQFHSLEAYEMRQQKCFAMMKDARDELDSAKRTLSNLKALSLGYSRTLDQIKNLQPSH